MTREWFASQLDYISFLYGLSFLLLAAASFRLTRKSDLPMQLPWPWLALFGLVHGANEWMDMLALSLSDPAAFNLARTAVLAVSFAALFEFGRRGLKTEGGRAPSIWILLPLFGLGGLGWMAGSHGMNAAFRYSLGLPGALLSACVLWRASSSAGNGGRIGLRLTAASMLVYAPAAGLIVNTAEFWPATWLNQDTFFAAAGFPIQMLRALCAFGCLGGIWLFMKDTRILENRTRLTNRWILPLTIALMIALGWIGAEWRERIMDERMRHDLIHKVSDITRTINTDRVLRLSFTSEDKDRPEFQRIRRQMIAYGRFANLHNIYSVSCREGSIVFGPGILGKSNYPLESAHGTMPGTLYRSPNPRLWEVFRNVQPVVVGPYTDEYGTFVSGFAPVVDLGSGDVLLVIGADVQASEWKRNISI